MPEEAFDSKIALEERICAAAECPGYAAPVRWYSRKKILSQLSLSGILPSWTGYWMHYRCYVRWRESWRK